MKTYSVIGQLAKARRDQNIPLEDVADRVGYEYETLLKIEYGHRNPSIGKLARWAEVLGFELSLTAFPSNPKGSAEAA